MLGVLLCGIGAVFCASASRGVHGDSWHLSAVLYNSCPKTKIQTLLDLDLSSGVLVFITEADPISCDFICVLVYLVINKAHELALLSLQLNPSMVRWAIAYSSSFENFCRWAMAYYIAEALKICADELRPLAQSSETCNVQMPFRLWPKPGTTCVAHVAPTSHPGDSWTSSCSSCSSLCTYIRRSDTTHSSSLENMCRWATPL